MPAASHPSSAAPRDPLGVGRYLAVPTTTTPAWLADSRIAFLHDASGTPQIWIAEPSGAATPLTTFSDRIGALLATPAGDRLVFGMDTGGDERQQIWTVVPGEEPRVITAAPAT